MQLLVRKRVWLWQYLILIQTLDRLTQVQIQKSGAEIYDRNVRYKLVKGGDCMEIFNLGMKFQLGLPSWNFYDYMRSFISGWKFKNLDFNENYFLNKWNFYFHPGMKLKLRLYGEKCFIPGWKFSLGVCWPDEISSQDEIFNFLHVTVIWFLYWKQGQSEMKFQLGCVIIISFRD